MSKTYLIALLFYCFVFFGHAQETLKTMFYNVLNYPSQSPASRVDQLEIIIEDYQPDLFMICELNNEQGADAILSAIQNVNSNYIRAAFVENTSDDNGSNQNDLQNMIYFDATKFSLESQSEVTTSVRDFNHYILKLNTVDQDTNPILLNVFVTHLKSASGSANQQTRFEMVTEFVNYLDTNVADDAFVLLGGDLNFYTQSEDGFQELLDASNDITLMDPADRIGSWHNNTNFIDVFTQSTRDQNGLGGAPGGFDDRFDFILTSENMASNSNLMFIDGSYKSYGNNQLVSCYNQAINSSDCGDNDSTDEYSMAIREALHIMSDHLPVVMQLQTDQNLSTESFNVTNAFEINGSTIVSEWLELQFDPIKLNAKSIHIFNTLGQKVDSYSIKNLNQLKINVSKWTNGIYYVVTSNSSVQPLKFIKN